MSRYTMTATIYRRTPSGVNSKGQTTYTWPAVVSGVQCRVQGAGAGSVVQSESGRVATATHWALFPSGTDLQPDDGVKITASAIASQVGTRFQVEKRFDWGRAGGMQADVVETMETFG